MHAPPEQSSRGMTLRAEVTTHAPPEQSSRGMALRAEDELVGARLAAPWRMNRAAVTVDSVTNYPGPENLLTIGMPGAASMFPSMVGA
jgi:hypothetical protein